MIARIKLWLALRRRKAFRLQHAAATKRGKLIAQRKRWANDAVRRAA